MAVVDWESALRSWPKYELGIAMRMSDWLVDRSFFPGEGSETWFITKLVMSLMTAPPLTVLPLPVSWLLDCVLHLYASCS